MPKKKSYIIEAQSKYDQHWDQIDRFNTEPEARSQVQVYIDKPSAYYENYRITKRVVKKKTIYVWKA